MTPPMVSVIVPTYQRANSVVKAVSSILEQEFKDLEVIVVDDHSSDTTRDIIQNLQNNDSRIKYLYLEKNGGPGGARNAGVAAARGEFIAFLDSDDEWKPGKLGKQVEFLQANPEIDVVFTDCTNSSIIRNTSNKLSFENGEFLRNLQLIPFPEYPDFYCLNGPVREELFRKFFILISSAVVRRSALTQVGGFNPNRRGAEDVDFFVRLSVWSKIAFWNEEKVIRYQSETGISTVSEKWLNELLAFYEMCLKSDDYLDLHHQTKRNLHSTFLGLMSFYGLQNHPDKVLSAYRRSLKYGFSPKLLLYLPVSLAGSFPLKLLRAQYRKKVMRRARMNSSLWQK